MKKLLLLLFLLPLVSAQPTDWFQASLVSAKIDVSSDIELSSKGPSPFVESVNADVIFVPQNSDFVAVRDLQSSPPALFGADRVRFEWKTPNIGRLSYRYSAVVDTANNVPRVTAKIPFPISIPSGFEKYTLPTKNIDSNDPKILGQAYSLAQNEDDLFMVVSKIAVWVKNNVEYNLSTLTAEVSQPASWVLDKRFGVCDEITSLFIAMLRSLKIPARFISGLAYTASSQFPQGWGAHGWAEVYFPGVGWVPFDPTFGEFGWVDPGHIKLKESLDPQEPTTVFEWKARDVDVRVNDLKLGAEVLKTQGRAPSELKLLLSPIRARVGFGSYNGVVLDVENLADYYVGAEFALTRVTDIDIIGGESRQIVLPPRGRGKLFWTVRVHDNLDPKFQYEIPLVVYNVKKDSAESSFAVGTWDVVFSEADVDSSIGRLVVARDPLDLACAFENDFVWTSAGKLNCLVQNKGDAELPVSVCFKGCRDVYVGPKSSLPLSYDVVAETPGPHEVEVTASSGRMSKKAVLTLVRLDKPKIAIKGVFAPNVVNYGDSFSVRFTLARESVSFPQNVSVSVTGGGTQASVDVGELTIDQEINVNIRSDQLYSSSPTFDIDVDYKDPFENKYESKGSVPVKVVGVPWYKRIVGWFVDLF
jgi:transglutaminase-like putative cysteine protease